MNDDFKMQIAECKMNPDGQSRKDEGEKETEKNAECRLQNDERRIPPFSSPLRGEGRVRVTESWSTD
jgi:hypothetical protein